MKDNSNENPVYPQPSLRNRYFKKPSVSLSVLILPLLGKR